ncbi:MAG: M23 family metallopeptidase [Leptospiraceae bacterium]|nr:M23 family metallopeptidase [Leptospiraceae bacterium]MCZ8344940.1 M23 family metallopeptidase [Leptospiraceae bacterium]
MISKNADGIIISKIEKNYDLQIKARNLSQGELILVKIIPKKKAVVDLDLRLTADGEEIPLSTIGVNRVGFIPVSPERTPGPLLLELFSKILFVKYGSKKYQIDIKKTDFIVIQKQSISLDTKYTSSNLSKETYQFIEECSKAKSEAFLSKSESQISSGFQYPVKEVYITSPFYVRRDYNQKKGRPHGGLDFRGAKGTPIYAIQDGTVVLAKEMYYEGNFTIIDHGNKIFSYYMHQSKLLVKSGDKISKGQIIGHIGSTGMSTGPHLHLGFKIGETVINPESVLFLSDL